MKTTLVRRAVTAGTVLVLAATAAVGAYATVVDPPGRVGNLASFGPLMDNGFPTSYTDSKAVRLEACITAADPLCAAATGPTYDPALPLAFPTNFPDEFFYQLASVTLNPLGNKLLVETNLEGAFATGPPIPGDQMVFARIRIKDVNAPVGATWRITHPYGVDQFTVGAGGIFSTADVGTVPGVFSGALNSRIGPFLSWDPATAPAAPVGYIGDPGVLHPVLGSPYGTNFVKVEQLDANGTTWTTLDQTNLFSLQGRKAVNAGVNIDAANFNTDATGASSLDVYASSDAGQSIQVSANAVLGTPIVPMREQTGRYYAHIAVPTLPAGKVPPGTTIEVVNAGDKPPAKKTATLADQVIITAATYDATAQTMTVTATSSDAETGVGLAPVLTMVDPMGATTPATLVNGTATFPAVPPVAPALGLTAPPATIKVTSSRGGSDTSQLTAKGTGFGAIVPMAIFTAPTTTQLPLPVSLDGTASTGGVPMTYSWTVTGPAVSPTVPGPIVTLPATTALTTWTPTVVGAYTVSLTVTGPGGTSLPATQLVTVTAAGAIVVNAGPPQTKTRGTLVQLAATATNATTYLWSQTAGPKVTLSSNTTLNPTFTYPRIALPVGPAGKINTGYSTTAGVNLDSATAIKLQLTASKVGVASASATVIITPTAETITPITTRYRTRGDWRVTGTSNLIAGQVIAMVLGAKNATNPVYIGQATVDAAGAFSFVGGLQPVVPAGTKTSVTYISSTGGTISPTLLITP
jgi:hypothetical protein